MREKIERALNELVAIEFKGNLLLNVPAINTVLKVTGMLTEVLQEIDANEANEAKQELEVVSDQ